MRFWGLADGFATPLLLYDEYTLNPKSRKEEWGVCKVCCSRGATMLVEQGERSG